MYLVAPLVITLGLSFVLYRESGKWKPVDLWPMDQYKQIDEIALLISKGGQGSEAALQQMRARAGVSDYTETAYAQFQERRQQQIREFEQGTGKTGAPGGGHGPG